MLMAPVEENNRARARGADGWPMPIEQLDPVMGRKGGLGDTAHGTSCFVQGHQPVSRKPTRTLFTVVTTSNVASNGMSQAAHGGSGSPTPAQAPRAPKIKARSLLPKGPSYRRWPPVAAPSTPAYSLVCASRTTRQTPAGPNGGSSANGAYSAASETASHNSFK